VVLLVSWDWACAEEAKRNMLTAAIRTMAVALVECLVMTRA